MNRDHENLYLFKELRSKLLINGSAIGIVKDTKIRTILACALIQNCMLSISTPRYIILAVSEFSTSVTETVEAFFEEKKQRNLIQNNRIHLKTIRDGENIDHNLLRIKPEHHTILYGEYRVLVTIIQNTFERIGLYISLNFIETLTNLPAEKLRENLVEFNKNEYGRTSNDSSHKIYILGFTSTFRSGNTTKELSNRRKAIRSFGDVVGVEYREKNYHDRIKWDPTIDNINLTLYEEFKKKFVKFSHNIDEFPHITKKDCDRNFRLLEEMGIIPLLLYMSHTELPRLRCKTIDAEAWRSNRPPKIINQATVAFLDFSIWVAELIDSLMNDTNPLCYLSNKLIVLFKFLLGHHKKKHRCAVFFMEHSSIEAIYWTSITEILLKHIAKSFNGCNDTDWIFLRCHGHSISASRTNSVMREFTQKDDQLKCLFLTDGYEKTFPITSDDLDIVILMENCVKTRDTWDRAERKDINSTKVYIFDDKDARQTAKEKYISSCGTAPKIISASTNDSLQLKVNRLYDKRGRQRYPIIVKNSDSEGEAAPVEISLTNSIEVLQHVVTSAFGGRYNSACNREDLFFKQEKSTVYVRYPRKIKTNKYIWQVIGVRFLRKLWESRVERWSPHQPVTADIIHPDNEWTYERIRL